MALSTSRDATKAVSDKPRRRICVIGAGISGLAAAKECKELGLDVVVYEMMPVIGGVFAHYGWRDGHLTSSAIFTWFSDFPIDDNRRSATKHLTWPEWLEYLGRYVEHFGIGSCFQFNTKVEAFERAPGGGWNVLFHRRNWSNGHWTHPAENAVEEARFEEHFDVLVVGTGLHNIPNDFSNVPGINSFVEAGGKAIHSAEFRSGAEYVGKRVVVVGAGESASDIARLTAENADKVAVSIRGKMGTLFPHRIGGDSADTRDSRLVYSLPRAVWPMLVKAHAAFYRRHPTLPDGRTKDRPDEFGWAADVNQANQSTIFTVNACKSFGIPQAIFSHGASQHSGIERIEGRTVFFADGTVFREATNIIFATGYKAECAAMVDPRLRKAFACPRSLWKNMCAVGEDDIFVLGFCRPNQINLITCCELQARAMALIVSGAKPKPSAEAQREEIASFKDHMAATFQRGSSALVDFMPFADGLAAFIGCAPSLSYCMLTDPTLWWYMLYGALQPSQYRLVGPGAQPQLARSTIVKTPIYRHRQNRLLRDTQMTLMSLCLHAASLLTNNRRYRLVGLLSKNADHLMWVIAALVANTLAFAPAVVIAPVLVVVFLALALTIVPFSQGAYSILEAISRRAAAG